MAIVFRHMLWGSDVIFTDLLRCPVMVVMGMVLLFYLFFNFGGEGGGGGGIRTLGLEKGTDCGKTAMPAAMAPWLF